MLEVDYQVDSIEYVTPFLRRQGRVDPHSLPATGLAPPCE